MAFPIFDAHCHIISEGFPLIENQGYLPPTFSVTQYLQELSLTTGKEEW